MAAHEPSGKTGARTGGGRRIPTKDLMRAWELHKEGGSLYAIAKEVGRDRVAIKKFLDGDPTSSGYDLYLELSDATLPGPIPLDALTDVARRAAGDFEFFRKRYHGRMFVPWHIDAAMRIQEMRDLAEADLVPRYLVINVAPGSGKSVMWRDYVEWSVVNDRTVRVLNGSATQAMADRVNHAIRQSMERIRPERAKPQDFRRGLAVDAEGCLPRDFGRFEPTTNSQLWRREEFTVEQMPGQSLVDKEATCTSFGLGTQFLGGRFDLAGWDDTQTRQQGLATAESRQKTREVWDDEAETRLDPGGLLVLIMQRLHPEDLSAHCLSKTIPHEWGIEPDQGEHIDMVPEEPKMYAHIVYPAHDEDRCTAEPGQYRHKDHSPRDAKPWHPDPEKSGCLLDPVRLPWSRLMSVKAKNPVQYDLVYQQKDTDLANHPIKTVFFEGGQGVDGVHYPGCVNMNRGRMELPQGAQGPMKSIITVDPSPTRMWGIIWWMYHPESQTRYVIDIFNEAAEFNEILDFDARTGQYSGLLVDWVKQAREWNRDISHIIFEKNAAQRFVFKITVLKQWFGLNDIRLIDHETTTNKSHTDLGIGALLPGVFARGLVDIPARAEAYPQVYQRIKGEHVAWPEGSRDDLVMSTWFLEYWLPRLRDVKPENVPKANIPSWVGEATFAI